MGSRIIPFEPNEKCDGCGVMGAYDFMGDFFCPKCTDKYIYGKDEEDTRQDSDKDIQEVVE